MLDHESLPLEKIEILEFAAGQKGFTPEYNKPTSEKGLYFFIVYSDCDNLVLLDVKCRHSAV